MDEREVKFFDINPEEIKRRLEEHDAEKVFSGLVTSIFMDKNYSDLRKSKRTLRLRSNNNSLVGEDYVESTLTFKKKRGDVGFRDHRELEVRIDDLEKCMILLGRLSFGDYDKDVKNRVSYKKLFGSEGDKRTTRFEFDTPTFPFDDLGTYLELEATRESDLREAAAMLCLPWEKATSMSYVEYVEKKKGRKPPYKEDKVSIISPYAGNNPELRRIRIPVTFNELLFILNGLGIENFINESFHVSVFDQDRRLRDRKNILLLYYPMGGGYKPIFLKYLGESQTPSFGLICDEISVAVHPPGSKTSESEDINVRDSVSSLLNGIDMTECTSFTNYRWHYNGGGITFVGDAILYKRDEPYCFVQIDSSTVGSLNEGLSRIKRIMSGRDLDTRQIDFNYFDALELSKF